LRPQILEPGKILDPNDPNYKSLMEQ